MIRWILWLIATVAIATPALLVRFAPAVPVARVAAGPTRRVVPAAELPPVEPVELVALAPDAARAFNAAAPFADGPNPAARPFAFAGAVEDRARATDCLAAAIVYEAGDDAAGEKAVAQVVLNRLRHPAFPKTVCGVVFEGATRRTGCQFTFTCDGALTRWRPTPDAWARAQAIAAQALGGAVYRPVGYATHYHADYVVPYWQSSLDKLAQVGAHLFFRWTGWWGTPPAFNRHPAGAEPVIAALASLTDGGLDPIAPGQIAANTASPPAVAATGDPDSFLITLPPTLAPELYPQLAAQTCAERPRCRFSAWRTRAETPTALPLTPQMIAATAFAYLRDRPVGLDKPLWNCRLTPRPDRSQCMKVQVFLPAPTPPAAMPSPAAVTDPVLQGVRRKSSTPTPVIPPPAALPTVHP